MKSRNSLLGGWLSALVALPAFAVLGAREGHGFILYREPKLIAVALLGWTFLALFFWIRRGAVSLGSLIAVLERPAVTALFAFLGWMSLTGLWVAVPANFFYEWRQYVLFGLLLVALLTWTRDTPQVARGAETALLVSLALLSAVGLVQWIVPLPWLTPINPEIGAPHPSFMGYKNPAALAVLGQIFLVAGRAVTASGGRRLLWSTVLAAELIYLASLGSRTSYAALAGSSVTLAVLVLVRRPRLVRPLLPAAAGALLVFGAVLLLYEPAGERAARLAELGRNPGAWLETDRGTYARNTWHMARLNPLGVGLGDWQTQYPVYRRYNRDLAFSEDFQVRRAHSDHVQILGEGGFPGLALWLLFLLLLGRAAIRGPTPRAFFLTAQLTAFAIAMAGDYLLELPYHKFQFFLVVFLILAARRDEGAPTPVALPSRLKTAGVLVFTLLVAVQVLYHLGQARKIRLAAELEGRYLHALERLEEDAPRAMAELALVVDAGRRLDTLPGHVKTLHRDYFVLGHAALLLGQRREARAWTRHGLALYPYSPNGLALMARLAEDPRQAEHWREIHRYVMKTATVGWSPVSEDGTLAGSGE